MNKDLQKERYDREKKRQEQEELQRRWDNDLLNPTNPLSPLNPASPISIL